MLLMFHFLRLDVFSLGDIGLIRRDKALGPEAETKEAVGEIAERWRPYRTAAAGTCGVFSTRCPLSTERRRFDIKPCPSSAHGRRPAFTSGPAQDACRPLGNDRQQDCRIVQASRKPPRPQRPKSLMPARKRPERLRMRARRPLQRPPAVADAKEARREKKDEQLTKIEDTRAELKEDGHIPLTPAMITLPEFEEERMALMAEEHDILVDLVDHMHAPGRVDQLEQTYKALAIEEKESTVVEKSNLRRL